MQVRIRCWARLPHELQLTETVEFVAHLSGKPMACYAYRNWQIQLLRGSARTLLGARMGLSTAHSVSDAQLIKAG